MLWACHPADESRQRDAWTILPEPSVARATRATQPQTLGDRLVGFSRRLVCRRLQPVDFEEKDCDQPASS